MTDAGKARACCQLPTEVATVPGAPDAAATASSRPPFLQVPNLADTVPGVSPWAKADPVDYLQSHGLPDFMDTLMKELQRVQPDDPYGYITKYARTMQVRSLQLDPERLPRLDSEYSTAGELCPYPLADGEAEEDAEEDVNEIQEIPCSPFKRHPQSCQRVPPLRILILIVGSRGDVQPFVAFGHGLRRRGHHVRIATHVCFREFILEQGFDYFPLKGDARELMRFIVEHPDMISFSQREVEANKHMLREIYESTWIACTISPEGAS